jgi:hypothetical protein
VRSDQRNTSRKILKVKALLSVGGSEPQVARTLDVGADGVCLVLDAPLPAGTVADVYFELFHEGQLRPITARSKVQYCILSNAGFKVGFQFVNLELSSMTILSKYMH